MLIGAMLLTQFSFAHDLYLTLEKDQRICAGIGEQFPVSMNAVTADRLTAFNVRKSKQVSPLKGAVADKQFCASSPMDNFIAEIIIQPRFIKLSAKDFGSYIHGEGLKAVEQRRADTGKQDTEGRELYSRYSKLIVGKLGAEASQVLGHSLEIVPKRDPSELKPGEPLQVEVLFKGKPLANAQISAVYAGAKLAGHEYPVTTRTDDNGMAELKLDRPGLWYARLIYMEPAQNDPDIDWRSYFSTLTFSIEEKRPSSSINESAPPAPAVPWDFKKVESSLRDAGLKVRRDVAVNQPFLSVPGHVLVVGEGDAEIQVYTYKSSRHRTADTDKLDPKTVTPPTMKAAWLMPPSLVANGNLAAIVLTRDEGLRQKIAAALNK